MCTSEARVCERRAKLGEQKKVPVNGNYLCSVAGNARKTA